VGEELRGLLRCGVERSIAEEDGWGWERLIRGIAALKPPIDGGADRQSQSGQQILIGLVAVKALRCQMMSEKVLTGGDLQDRVENYFLAWSNSIRRDLEALGVLNSASGGNDAPFSIQPAEMTDEQLDAALALLERQQPISVLSKAKWGGEVESVAVESPSVSNQARLAGQNSTDPRHPHPVSTEKSSKTQGARRCWRLKYKIRSPGMLSTADQSWPPSREGGHNCIATTTVRSGFDAGGVSSRNQRSGPYAELVSTRLPFL
jgi:hypothetical protein